MGFSPKTYLEAQGWAGDGKPLKKGGRSRPILHTQKKTLGGVGKDTYNSFPWWDALFAGVANKLATSEKPSSGLKKTQTGILSPLEPAKGAPMGSTGGVLEKHADVLADVQRDHARATLYASFVRGPVSVPVVVEEAELPEHMRPDSDQDQDDDDEPAASTSASPPQPEHDLNSNKEEGKQKKKEKKGQAEGESKEERRARKAAKRAAKARTTPPSTAAQPVRDKSSKKRKSESAQNQLPAAPEEVVSDAAARTTGKKDKKRKTRPDDHLDPEQDAHQEEVKREKKKSKKRRKDAQE